MKNKILGSTTLVLAITLTLLLFFRGKEEKSKIAYVDTIYLYENAEIQKHYSKILDVKTKRNKYILDSLFNIANKERVNIEAVNYAFGKKREELESEIMNLEKEFYSKIWNQITEYTLQYGKKHNYDYIIGANGQGNLMYAKESNNISPDVLKFINEKFNDE